MPQSVLLPAAPPAAGSAGPVSQTSTPTSGSARSASAGGRFDECLNKAQQRDERQKDASGKKADNNANTAASDKASNTDKTDKTDKSDKSHKADKKDKAAANKDKKDLAVDANANTAGTAATKPQEAVDDSASGDKTLTIDTSEAESEASAKAQSSMDANSAASKAETVASASDDPWLQQITASRQALQSAKGAEGGAGSASKEANLNALSQLTGVSGRTQVPSAELDASGKLNASAEQMAAALKGAGEPKVEASAVSSQHTESALKMLLGTDEPSDNATSKADSTLLAATKAATHQATDTPAAAAHPQAATHDFLDSLRQAQGNNGLSAMRQPEPQAPTPLPLRHPEQSAQALQEQVQFLLNRKLDTVEIRLDPPELGNLQIKLHLNQDQAQVGIVVQNSHARELLEQTLPRLREMLAQQGIQLGQTQVQQQSQQQQGGASGQGQDLRGAPGHSGNSLGNGSDVGTDEALTVQQHTVTGSAHAVDYYA
ncbi:flagellar hook-length control protein FliK [Plesiomonas shigelloides]|uniref:flagellar hook-length control protein FliK n=1 Tax=Plesiomonas shigelloides TaxID=703 RepID=UPI001C049337|nr:flagellar hook-length control protein FliK [Plesiomonas shigelloides]QWK95187.1 flagellar hook-length control protein FliK [Plesiomonas shigelloides]